MTNTALKTQIDTQITNETVKSGITPTEVGNNIKAVVDYADQQDVLKVDKVAGERLINASEITKLSNTSGTNTGDETTSTIKTKLGITTLSGSNTGDQDLSGKQDVLVSSTNIKTVNGDSLLGSGDLVISSGGIDLPYKNYVSLLSFEPIGSVFTEKVLKNDIGANIVWTNPTNGRLQGTASIGNPFTANKTFIQNSTCDGSDGAYFAIGWAFSNTIVRIILTKYDGTITGTPSFIDQPIEIRVYN